MPSLDSATRPPGGRLKDVGPTLDLSSECGRSHPLPDPPEAQPGREPCGGGSRPGVPELGLGIPWWERRRALRPTRSDRRHAHHGARPRESCRQGGESRHSCLASACPGWQQLAGAAPNQQSDRGILYQLSWSPIGGRGQCEQGYACTRGVTTPDLLGSRLAVRRPPARRCPC